MFTEVLENVNPDLSDSEYMDRQDAMDAPTPGFGGSEAGDVATPGADLGERDEEAEQNDVNGRANQAQTFGTGIRVSRRTHKILPRRRT